MRGRAGSRARSFHLIDFPLISDIGETEEWVHGLFPHHQGVNMGQPQPQWLYCLKTDPSQLARSPQRQANADGGLSP